MKQMLISFNHNSHTLNTIFFLYFFFSFKITWHTIHIMSPKSNCCEVIFDLDKNIITLLQYYITVLLFEINRALNACIQWIKLLHALISYLWVQFSLMLIWFGLLLLWFRLLLIWFRLLLIWFRLILLRECCNRRWLDRL